MIHSPIEEIKNKLDIVEVIGNYIKLQKAGANYRAVCPFHSEKKPSFFVSPDRQIWHCFGCAEGGDMFKFVMKIEGIEFGDALRILAQKAGIELKKQTPESASLRTERQRFYEICELAALFFEKQLKASNIGKKAKKYLLDRGIKEESINKWRLGYAPDSWQGLSDFLVGRGYERQEIEKTGLAIKKEKGGWYDRFRTRIMFPIFDLSGQVVGFTGRIFGDKAKEEVAKYVNTPNTLLYDKSRILYGLDKAKVAIRKEKQCILVEGQTDVIMSHQIGQENVVATSGTALTPFQLNILKRYSSNLMTAFDMDVAGDSATKRGIDLAQAQGFDIKVLVLPQGSDPADIISKSPAQFKKSVESALSILEFYFQTAFARFDAKTPEGKNEISKILLPIIKKIPNKIVQSHWIQELSKKLNVKEEDIEVELKKSSLPDFHYQERSEKIAGPKQSLPKSRKQMIEERVISLILEFPEMISLIDKDFLDYFSPQSQEVLIAFKKTPDADFLKNLKKYKFSSEINDFLNLLALKVESEPDDDFAFEKEDIEPEEECLTCLKELISFEIKNKLEETANQIKRAEELKDSKKVNSLVQDFNKLTEKLINNNAPKKEE